ncbi:hypothetical protein [Paraburkholderia terrae]|uniref:Secreted protein n=1 Tax=Paraburkholderia terrae TaxID=311230 RepID=A0ABN6JV83_9BURK|nr:hypothetical protein [Paraburkholderia terrae]BCZ84890.1 hypothetical protein PTKU64_85650 [Paraburkholderia terrae]BDC44865.1 hypothetical protein PTKU15_81620 [Paraburkholderia terrae]
MNTQLKRGMIAIVLALVAMGPDLTDAATDGPHPAAACRTHSATGWAAVKSPQGTVPGEFATGPSLTAQWPINKCSGTKGREPGISPGNAASGYRHVIFIWPML